MNKGLRKVLIIGAGVAGRELLGALNKNLSKVFKVIGFIDDDPKKANKKIKGVRVLGGIDSLEKSVKKHKVEEVFIALPSVEGETIKRIIEACNKQKIVFKIVPRILEIVLGKVNLQQIREVRIEDLLGRPIIRSDQKKFIDFFEGKKILVTGAAGSIGSELCRQLVQFNLRKLVCLDVWESGLFDLESQLKNFPGVNFEIVVGNIQDVKKIDYTFAKFKPDYIFHAAAYKHVPLMQENPDESVKNNVFGTKNLADSASKHSVKKFINISTDKAAAPSSIMGTTKLLAEKIVQSANSKKSTKYISVRFGNVLDSQGSVVPIFRKQILNGGPVTVTDPRMSRFFMTIPEAVQLVLEASILGEGGEIFVLDMGQPVKIDDLARLMIQLSGFLPEREIKIKYTGKRPGEKFTEILNTDDEFLEKTGNEKVFLIKQGTLKDENLNYILNSLKKMTYSKKAEDIVHFLRRIAANLQT